MIRSIMIGGGKVLDISSRFLREDHSLGATAGHSSGVVDISASLSRIDSLERLAPKIDRLAESRSSVLNDARGMYLSDQDIVFLSTLSPSEMCRIYIHSFYLILELLGFEIEADDPSMDFMEPYTDKISIYTAPRIDLESYYRFWSMTSPYANLSDYKDSQSFRRRAISRCDGSDELVSLQWQYLKTFERQYFRYVIVREVCSLCFSYLSDDDFEREVSRYDEFGSVICELDHEWFRDDFDLEGFLEHSGFTLENYSPIRDGFRSCDVLPSGMGSEAPRELPFKDLDINDYGIRSLVSEGLMSYETARSIESLSPHDIDSVYADYKSELEAVENHAYEHSLIRHMAFMKDRISGRSASPLYTYLSRSEKDASRVRTLPRDRALEYMLIQDEREDDIDFYGFSLKGMRLRQEYWSAYRLQRRYFKSIIDAITARFSSMSKRDKLLVDKQFYREKITFFMDALRNNSYDQVMDVSIIRQELENARKEIVRINEEILSGD